jgi:nitrile hydratase
MSRINDIGGMDGFGPVEGDDEPFHADWEARVFALNTVLLQKGIYTIDELRDAVERIPAADYVAASYFERRFVAMTGLLRSKGIVS